MPIAVCTVAAVCGLAAFLTFLSASCGEEGCSGAGSGWSGPDRGDCILYPVSTSEDRVDWTHWRGKGKRKRKGVEE